MALDGAFLYQLKQEIGRTALGARVEKVYQPSREELILVMRGRNASARLLLSARANSARIHLTNVSPENPAVPPMFCMLLRKRLNSAKLTALRQPGLERVLALDFECVNELGDIVQNSLVMEIMGRYSNIILVDDAGRVVDSIKRVDAEMSSARLVLPGLAYQLPPAQDKLNILQTTAEEITSRLRQGQDADLSKALLGCLQGLSPIVCRELQAQVCRGGETRVAAMEQEQWERLVFFLNRLKELICGDAHAVMVCDLEGKPMDVSFLDITQYGLAAATSRFDSFSAMLDAFYAERDTLDRMKARSMDLLKLLTAATGKLSRKISAQQVELAQCADREQWRIYGDLLNANLYRLEKGSANAEVENYFEPELPVLRIPLDPALSPAQNAQKYYKEYRRAQTAEQMLQVQIRQAQEELAYLETVFDALSRASSERDLAEIRQELTEQGYLKRSKGKQKPAAPAAPLQFRTSDGCAVYVGRNNRQNDQLTLRTAGKQDYWFHTKNIPGSHVILNAPSGAPSAQAIREAAEIAAYHSHAGASSQVPVDYTQARNVRKPQGAKPGMVIYDAYQTVYVTPERARVESMAVQKK